MSVARVNRWLGQNWTGLTLAVLLPAAFALRVYGLDWDRGLLFHPDERQILMVVESLYLPEDPLALLGPESPLNPRFFAYGSFPIYLLRLVSCVLGLQSREWATMARSYLIGRVLSALFDTCSVYATYLLARKTFGRRVAILAAVLVSFTVLHLQLAHFYTVDTILTTLVLLAVGKAVDVARRGKLRDGASFGLLFGVALATKVSVLPLAAVVVLAWLSYAWPAGPTACWTLSNLTQAWHQVRGRVLLSFGLALASFLLLEPYALIDWYRFGQAIGQEAAMSQGWFDFPYTRQYIGTVPYVYQARQILLFAMGPLLGILGLGGLLWLVIRLWRKPAREVAVVVSWPLLYAVLQGIAHAKFIRYTLPVLPFLCVAGAVMWMAAWDASGAPGRSKGMRRFARPALAVVLSVVLVTTLSYALAFLNIYSHPHPWLQASSWLCQCLPEGSTIVVEYWDDPLPVRSNARSSGCRQKFAFVQLDLYAPDTAAKLEQLLDAIQSSDYIVLSSQRLYATITRLPQRYPMTSRYYQQLFAERLGFQLVAAPAVYPRLCGIVLVDNPSAGLELATPRLLEDSRPTGLAIDLGQADESFTVYDHPQPLVFAKVRQLLRSELRELLIPPPTGNSS